MRKLMIVLRLFVAVLTLIVLCSPYPLFVAGKYCALAVGAPFKAPTRCTPAVQ